jgi:uncharacterized protein YjbI with pentapeptide repeats
MNHHAKADIQSDFAIDLSGAFVRRVDLSGAILVGADFSGADCSNANFRGADFEDANLRGTILKGADLTGALNLTREQIREAKVDADTLLPPGLL